MAYGRNSGTMMKPNGAQVTIAEEVFGWGVSFRVCVFLLIWATLTKGSFWVV